MKKKIIKTVVSMLLIANSLIIPASAGTWIPHEGYDLSITGGIYKGAWEYQYDDGTKGCGWEYIGNNWYYFDKFDGCAARGFMSIDGKDYYFGKTDCIMKHDQYVKVGEGTLSYYYWACSDGHIDYSICKIPDR
jgi:hypothetical protein